MGARLVGVACRSRWRANADRAASAAMTGADATVRAAEDTAREGAIAGVRPADAVGIAAALRLGADRVRVMDPVAAQNAETAGALSVEPTDAAVTVDRQGETIARIETTARIIARQVLIESAVPTARRGATALTMPRSHGTKVTVAIERVDRVGRT